MVLGDRTDPYLDFRYVVEVGETKAGFAEVSGIEVEVETEEYQEGGVNHHPHVLPTRASQGNVTFRRGMTDDALLWSWAMAATRGQAERKLVRVVLQDRLGRETVGWEFHRSLPVRWVGPDLVGDRGEVAIEEFELAYETITRHGGNQ